MSQLENNETTMNSVKLTESRYLCFSLGSQEYAIPLLTVREVIAMPEITSVPFTPPYFLGIMNLRGQVISILDLRQKFNIKPKEATETAVVICQFDGFSIGVVVDSVNSVLAPEPEMISPKPEMSGQKNSEYITSVYRKENELILLLDIAKTLNVDDHKAITNSKQSSTQKAA